MAPVLDKDATEVQVHTPFKFMLLRAVPCVVAAHPRAGSAAVATWLQPTPCISSLLCDEQAVLPAGEHFMHVTMLTRAALLACLQVTLPGGGLWYDNLDGRTIDAAQEANRNFRWACSAASTAFGGDLQAARVAHGACSWLGMLARALCRGASHPELQGRSSHDYLHLRSPCHDAVRPPLWTSSAPTCGEAPCCR